jgi:multiple sugar transport system substrate-binding protein
VNRTTFLCSLIAILGLLLLGCTPVSPSPQTKTLITWFPYDQENTDLASDERVGNQYLRETIPQFNAAFKGTWSWVNIPKAFDKVIPELVAAHISGGEVPDLVETGRILTYAQNGALLDLTGWARMQPWYTELDPASLVPCISEGKLLCIPLAERPYLTYVWRAHYPNGFPHTPDAFLTEAERLKNQGVYAITFFGSTAFNGNAWGRGLWSVVSSFGGKYDDGKGNLYLTSPETIAAIQFLREIVARGYVPEAAFAGSFAEEQPFKDSRAASFPTGLFGYRYLNPLTAPDGTKFEKKTADDMLDAVSSGAIQLAPMFAPEGHLPGCGLSVSSLGIPARAKNPAAAKDFINWLMADAETNAAYVTAIGAGFPANRSYQNHTSFQGEFYRQAAETINASRCTPVEGSLKRPEEAAVIVSNVIYRLIKEDPRADVVSELKKAEAEYNRNN